MDPEFAEYACVERQRLDSRSVEMMKHQISDRSVQGENLLDQVPFQQRGNRDLSAQGVTFGEQEIVSPQKFA
jgi:hypothetical protein